MPVCLLQTVTQVSSHLHTTRFSDDASVVGTNPNSRTPAVHLNKMQPPWLQEVDMKHSMRRLLASMTFLFTLFGVNAAFAPQAFAQVAVSQKADDCESAKAVLFSKLEVCEKERADCLEKNEAWKTAYETLRSQPGCDGPPATDAAHPPTVPSPAKKKAAAPRYVAPPQKKLICEPPATKDSSGRFCECPDGFPARVVDTESHAFDQNTVKGICAPTLEMFQKLRDDAMNRFAALCKPGSETSTLEDCIEKGKKLDAIILWYDKLVSTQSQTTPPLNWESWDRLWKRVNALENLRPRVERVEQRISAVERNYCHQDAEGDWMNCPNEVGLFHGGIVFQLPLVGTAWFRPGGNQHTYSLTINPTLIGMFNAKDGLYIKGYVGYGHSKRSDRVPTGGGLGWYHAFTPDRTVALRLGAMVGAEPAIRGNDAFNAGADVGIQFRPGNGHFLIDLGVIGGATKVFVYPQDSDTGRGHPSGTGFLIAPGIGLGFDFHGS